MPGTHDKFFTGQVLWALDGLADVGLDDGDRDTLRRVGDYLPLRDELEDFEPPVSDHWAAYAYDGLGLDAHDAAAGRPRRAGRRTSSASRSGASRRGGGAAWSA